MSNRRTLIAAAIVGALGVPSAASALTIDGITIAPGAIIERVEVFEGERFGDGIGNDNGIIDLPGEELIGIGRVLTIRKPISEGGALLWSHGDNGRELTAYFHSYIAQIPAVVGSTIEIFFTGGKVELYSDATPNFSPAGTQAAAIATATDPAGSPWLTMDGSPIGGLGSFDGLPQTLKATVLSTGFTGFVLGNGLLDVTGGAAASVLDTNTFGCIAADGPPCPDDADKTYSSSGVASLGGGGNTFGFEGTAEVTDNAIPEPGVLALMGLGLLGLGVASRRKLPGVI